MPTYNRPDFLARALSIFDSYSYGKKELIIVDDSPAPTYTGNRPDVKYVMLRERTNLGVKHNIAARMAQGEVMAAQDDDDLFAPQRLSKQLEPIVRRECDMTGYRMRDMIRFPEMKFYRFKEGVKILPGPRTTGIYLPKFHDSTAMWRREIWDAGIQFSNQTVFQKGDFLNDACRAGYKAKALDNNGEFIYARHKGNTWQFNPNLLIEVVPPIYVRKLVNRGA